MLGNHEVKIETVMRTTVSSSDKKRGIQPTLYNPVLNFNLINNYQAALDMQNKLRKANPNIGCAHICHQAQT